MATLILDCSNPVLLVCIVGAAATISTIALVAGIAAIAEAVRSSWPRRIA